MAFYQRVEQLTGMNDLLNCLMSLMLPFALIPAVTFSSSPDVMGTEFASGKASKMFSILLSCLIVAVNIYFSINYIYGLHLSSWWAVMPVSLAGFGYLAFCAYLSADMLLNMGGGAF